MTSIRYRKYFKSIYFHAPGGVFIEIATDPPDFTVDEHYESLGRDLKLQDQYESMRAEIESQPPKSDSTGFVSNYHAIDQKNKVFRSSLKMPIASYGKFDDTELQYA